MVHLTDLWRIRLSQQVEGVLQVELDSVVNGVLGVQAGVWVETESKGMLQCIMSICIVGVRRLD